jgi:hypothetical protein
MHVYAIICRDQEELGAVVGTGSVHRSIVGAAEASSDRGTNFGRQISHVV